MKLSYIIKNSQKSMCSCKSKRINVCFFCPSIILSSNSTCNMTSMITGITNRRVCIITTSTYTKMFCIPIVLNKSTLSWINCFTLPFIRIKSNFTINNNYINMTTIIKNIYIFSYRSLIGSPSTLLSISNSSS